MDNYLDLATLAKTLSISVRQARRLVGEHPGVLNIGTGKRKHLRVPESAVSDLLLAKRNRSGRRVRYSLL